MKVVHPKINSRIEISDQRISVLVIEAPDFLYELLTDIKRQMDNFDGDTVISIHDEPVRFHKYVELVTDPLAVEMNNRTIIKKYWQLWKNAGRMMYTMSGHKN